MSGLSACVQYARQHERSMDLERLVYKLLAEFKRLLRFLLCSFQFISFIGELSQAKERLRSIDEIIVRLSEHLSITLGSLVQLSPAITHIERQQEETRPVHCFEELFAIIPPGDGVTEGTRQAAEHACLQEEDLQRLWLCVQHFGDEVLQKMPMAAGEGRKVLLDLLR